MTTVLIDETTTEGKAFVELLRKMKFARVVEDAGDWWPAISPAERQAIEEGLTDVEKGKVIPHEHIKEQSSGCKIEWSARAVDDFNRIIQYISQNWNKRETRKFICQINKNISYIWTSPLIFPATSHHQELRQCVVSEIHNLYYLVENKTIYLITIWDNRWDICKLKNLIKQ